MECRFCGANLPAFPESGLCPKCNFRMEPPAPVEGNICGCGTQNKPNAKFCRSCGKALGQPAATATPAISGQIPLQVKEADPPRIMPDLKFAPITEPPPPVEQEPPPPRVIASVPRRAHALSYAGGAVAGLLLLGLGIALLRHARTTPSATPAPILTPTPTPEAQIMPSAVSVPANPDWFLKGGEISGGFIPAGAQAEWPEWMQALVGTRVASSSELGKSNFYCVPDRFLGHAVEVLDAQKVFTPDLLGQVLAIGYAADTAAWRIAKGRYLKDYLAAEGLPVGDAPTCSRLLTQMTYAKEYPAVRTAIQTSGFPGDSDTRNSWLRMVDLEEGPLKATPELVLDQTHPAAERFYALIGLPKSAPGHDLVESFRGTPFFPNAVYQAVIQGWCTPADPLVEEALQLEVVDPLKTEWFMIQNSERISDLLWLSCVDALGSGRKEDAVRLADSLLQRFPNSWYSGHAIFLLSAMGQSTADHASRMTMPSDVTIYNAETLSLGPTRRSWPPPFDALANQGRFDLIMARVNPRSQPEIYLAAASAAGQTDLAGRFMAIEKKGSAEYLPLTYPCGLAPVLEGIIQEEGLADQVDSAFVLSVIKGESLFQPWASSSADASGLMQLLKPTFKRMMGKKADISDPLTNIHGGLRYFKQIIKTAGLQGLPKEVRYAYLLAGYHAGEGRAKNWRAVNEARLNNGTDPEQTLLRVESIPILSTRLYLTRVLGDYEIYSKLITK